jgi:hypothetical protein
MRRVSDSVTYAGEGSDLRPAWHYAHTTRRDLRFRRGAHLFTGLVHHPDPFGSFDTFASWPSVCNRVRSGARLDFAGSRPPPNACGWCLRAGRRLGLTAADAY